MFVGAVMMRGKWGCCRDEIYFKDLKSEILREIEEPNVENT